MTHPKYAHKLVAETAKEIAACFYEELAHDNDFYKFYPKQRFFVIREWRRFINPAKAQLALLLGQSTTSEFLKEEIMDALIKHSQLPGNIDRRVAQQMIAAGDVPDIKQTQHTVH